MDLHILLVIMLLGSNINYEKTLTILLLVLSLTIMAQVPQGVGYQGVATGRPKGSVSTTTKLIREHISQAIDGNKIMDSLRNNS